MNKYKFQVSISFCISFIHNFLHVMNKETDGSTLLITGKKFTHPNAECTMHNILLTRTKVITTCYIHMTLKKCSFT